MNNLPLVSNVRDNGCRRHPRIEFGCMGKLTLSFFGDDQDDTPVSFHEFTGFGRIVLEDFDKTSFHSSRIFSTPCDNRM